MNNDAADLLAALFAPSETTPAIPANSANREDRRGVQPDSVTCDSLRLSAIRPEKSQPVAEQSQRADGPESEAGRGNSQKSQDSQGAPGEAAEASRFAQRRGDFMRRGFPEIVAEDMAARLKQRDEEKDDRAFCLECSQLSSRGRCTAAIRLVEPVPNVLVRCGAFKAKAQLSQEISRGREMKRSREDD
jgi:hypothetical protein